MNRKLIRPDLTEIKDQFQTTKCYRQRKPVPPEQTNAESFYYLKQMTNKTRMVIVLKDGEEIRGIIEWYDKHALKVHRSDRAQHPPPEGQREVHVQGERGQGRRSRLGLNDLRTMVIPVTPPFVTGLAGSKPSARKVSGVPSSVGCCRRSSSSSSGTRQSGSQRSHRHDRRPTERAGR